MFFEFHIHVHVISHPLLVLCIVSMSETIRCKPLFSTNSTLISNFNHTTLKKKTTADQVYKFRSKLKHILKENAYNKT